MSQPASKDDVQRAVREALGDLRSDIQRIRDDVQKIEQRTNDLDQSQAEIKRVIERMETLGRQMDDVHADADKIDRAIIEINSLKSPLASTTQYLKDVASYLASVDQVFRDKFGDPNERRS